MKQLIVAGMILVASLGCDSQKTVATHYKTINVAEEQIFSVIRATGTIEPEDLIDVGAQVTGQILSFGTDTEGKEVDYCSHVKAGQLLAQIDSVTYDAELRSAKAALATAKAEKTRAEADLKQLEAKLHQAQRNWDRAQRLGVGDALSQASYDAYQSEYEVAVASVEIGRTAIIQAEASIEQGKATVEKAERNLSYCRILSPVDGVIIDRRVNIGQTVVSSMSTSSLFLLAKDLSRIQIWVPVNEADIGNIHVGMKVHFTVDAFVDKNFVGTVEKIRLNASMTSNVVTYTVEVATTNPESLLLPYLTANVSFVQDESAPDACVVPIAALRWSPVGEPSAPAGQERVFVLDADDKPRAVTVKSGVTDGSKIEISGEGITAGTRVVIGVTAEEKAPAEQAAEGSPNPFLPKGPKMEKNRRMPPM